MGQSSVLLGCGLQEGGLELGQEKSGCLAVLGSSYDVQDTSMDPVLFCLRRRSCGLILHLRSLRITWSRGVCNFVGIDDFSRALPFAKVRACSRFAWHV